MRSIVCPQNIFGISAPFTNDCTKIITQTLCFNFLKPSNDSLWNDSVRGFTIRGSNPGEKQNIFSISSGPDRDRNPVGGEIFPTCPDRPWGPPNLLHNGYRVFPGGKAAGAWLWPPTPSSAEVKERIELYLCSPSRPTWPVVGWLLPLPLPLPDLIWEQATVVTGYRSSLTGKRRHLNLVPGLSMSGDVPPHLPCAFMLWTGRTLLSIYHEVEHYKTSRSALQVATRKPNRCCWVENNGCLLPEPY